MSILEVPKVVAERPVEILEYDKMDIVLNRSARLAGLAPQIIEAIKYGEMQAWPAIIIPERNNHIREGEIEGVSLVFKRKKASEHGYLPPLNLTKRDFQMKRSILPELAISASIRDVVESEAGQNLAKADGFNGFRYIEPILGVSFRHSGRKALVYERVLGARTLMDVEEDRGWDRDMGDLPLGHLYYFFRERGLLAHDLTGDNLLVDPANNLNLIDAEYFQRLRPGAGSRE